MTEGAPKLSDESFPAIFRQADESSQHAQEQFLIATGSGLGWLA